MSPAATKGKVDLDKTREALLALGLDFAAESLAPHLAEATKENPWSTRAGSAGSGGEFTKE